MSDLDAIRFDPAVALADGEPIDPAHLESGTPTQRAHVYFEDAARGLSAGIWDCTAMTGRSGPYSVDEYIQILEGVIELVLPDGSVERFAAGDAFVIPKGLVCQWRQPGYVKKYFVIHETPGKAVARPEAKVARVDVKAALEPIPGPDPAVLASGSPAWRDHTAFQDGAETFLAGLWDSDPYHRKPLAFPRHELMTLLEGSVTIAGPKGAQTFAAGETFFVPLGAVTDFRTDGYLKKIYVNLLV